MSDKAQYSKKKKFVADGVFRAELNAFLADELSQDGYSGVIVEPATTNNGVKITIQAVKPKLVMGTNNVRCHELESVIQKRFGFSSVKIFGHKVSNEDKGLCPQLKAEQIKAKLLSKLVAPRKVAMSTIKHIMDCKAKGVQVIISGKLTGQRAKATKYGDGFMIGSGDAKRDYIVEGVRHVLMPQGIMGVKVRIMLPQSDKPQSSKFIKRQMDDYVKVFDPVEEEIKALPIPGQ